VSASPKIEESRKEYDERNYTLIYTDNPDFNLATPETGDALSARLEQAWEEGAYIVPLVIWVDDPENEDPDKVVKRMQPFWYQLVKICGFGDR
jgi:hypothetical protein